MNALPWILATVVSIVAGQLLQKAGMRRVGAITRDRAHAPMKLAAQVLRQPLVVSGLMVYGFSAILWIYVLSLVELSFAFPFLAIAYAGVTGASSLVLGERFTLKQWLGLTCVVWGVALVAASG
jgi:drug/metabolite transporter (DMT)-like permease